MAPPEYEISPFRRKRKSQSRGMAPSAADLIKGMDEHWLPLPPAPADRGIESRLAEVRKALAADHEHPVPVYALWRSRLVVKRLEILGRTMRARRRDETKQTLEDVLREVMKLCGIPDTLPIMPRKSWHMH